MSEHQQDSISHALQDPESGARCMNCGILLNDHFALCPACRKFQSKERLLFDSPYPRRVRRCHLCGWRSHDDAFRCARCGQPLFARFNTLRTMGVTQALVGIAIGGATAGYGLFVTVFGGITEGVPLELLVAVIGLIVLVASIGKLFREL